MTQSPSDTAYQRTVGPVTVVGAGAAGLALAATLVKQEVTVRLCNRSSATAEAIAANRGIIVRRTGGAPEVVCIEEVSENIPATVAGSPTVFMAVSGGAEEELLLGVLGALEDTRIIVLVSGRCGVALTCAEILQNSSLADYPLLVDLSFPFVATRDAPGEVHIVGEKNWCPVAAEPSLRTCEGVAVLRSLLPNVGKLVTPLWMSLHCIPGVIFPAIMICNASRLARGEDFAFYGEGAFADMGCLLEKIDNERIEIAEAVGVKPLSAFDWFQRAYGVQGSDLVGVISNSRHYSARRAPKTLQHRFLLDNIPLCVVPLVVLADRVGVATPMLNSVIELGSALTGKDLRAVGELRSEWVWRLPDLKESSALA
jgi:opine dehydrogenase